MSPYTFVTYLPGCSIVGIKGLSNTISDPSIFNQCNGPLSRKLSINWPGYPSQDPKCVPDSVAIDVDVCIKARGRRGRNGRRGHELALGPVVVRLIEDRILRNRTEGLEVEVVEWAWQRVQEQPDLLEPKQ
jgi:hypothetical protein